MAFTKLISGIVLVTLFSVIFAQSVEEIERSGSKKCDSRCYPDGKYDYVIKICPKHYGKVVKCDYKEKECRGTGRERVCRINHIYGFKCACKYSPPSPTPSTTSTATATPTPTSSISVSPSPVCKPTTYRSEKYQFVKYFNISKYYGKVPYHYSTYGYVSVVIKYRGKVVYTASHGYEKVNKKGTLKLPKKGAKNIKLIITRGKPAGHWTFSFGCPKYY